MFSSDDFNPALGADPVAAAGAGNGQAVGQERLHQIGSDLHFNRRAVFAKSDRRHAVSVSDESVRSNWTLGASLSEVGFSQPSVTFKGRVRSMAKALLRSIKSHQVLKIISGPAKLNAECCPV